MKTATGVRRRASLVVPAIIATVLLGACGSDGGGLRSGTVAAKVGDASVSTDAVVKAVDSALKAGSENTDRAALSRQYLNAQIKLALFRLESKTLGFALTDKDRGATKAELEKRTAGTGGLVAAAGKAGIGADEIDDIIELLSYETAFIEKLGAKPPTKAEVDEIKAGLQQPYEEQAHSAHILVKDEATAKTILAELKNGGDFAALAKKHTTDPSGKDNGGDLGTGPPGRFVPEFDKALFAAKEGEIVGPVKTQFGYHIIKLIDLQTFDEFVARGIGAERLKAGVARDTKVEINPRFGVWDAKRQTVIAAGEDPDAPSSPSAATQEPEEPLGSAPAGQSPAP